MPEITKSTQRMKNNSGIIGWFPENKQIVKCTKQLVLRSKMKEFPDESVTVFTVLYYVQRGIRLKPPFTLSSRTFTRRGTPKAKSVMMWILQKLLRHLEYVVFSVFKWSH